MDITTLTPEEFAALAEKASPEERAQWEGVLTTQLEEQTAKLAALVSKKGVLERKRSETLPQHSSQSS